MLDVPHEPGKVENDYRQLLLSNCPLIDVRAPVEFSRGAFPHSVNLPLMNDDERHQVGICYKQHGQDAAIALGAKLVTPQEQIARVREWTAYLKVFPQARLYCFRGGLRSRISQQWLAEAGMDVPVVSGGFKAMRTYLINELDRLCSELSFGIIGGRTGNGKTLLLSRLSATVDLEKLANHRGSSFGAMPYAQPSNIDYENALTVELMRLDARGQQLVFLEDEARLIGRVCNPERLRKVMTSSPIYILECAMAQRVDNCFGDYVTDLLQHYMQQFGELEGFETYAAHHRHSLERIQKRFGAENYKQALALLDTALLAHREHNDTDAYRAFIEMLLHDYYDPMYDYQIAQKSERIVFRGTADQIVSHIQADKYNTDNV